MAYLDNQGVEYLWSKLSLEDYPNNEVLMAVLNAIDETKADRDELNKTLLKEFWYILSILSLKESWLMSYINSKEWYVCLGW